MLGTPGCSISGNYDTDSSGVFAENEMYFMPLQIPQGGTVTDLTLQMAVPDGNTMQAALYEDNGSGQPGAIRVSGDAIPVPNAGPFTMALAGGSGALVPAGVVWLGILGTGGTNGSYSLVASGEQTADFQYDVATAFPASVGAAATDEGSSFGALAVDLNGCAVTPTITPTSTPSCTPVPTPICQSWSVNDNDNGQASYTYGTGVAVDAAGDVFTIGAIYNGSQWGAHTAKFGPDGTLLWKNDDFGTGDEFWGDAIAVDQQGSAIIVGYDVAGGNVMMRTVKYGPTGALLWAVDDNDGGSSTDTKGRGISVDSSGNIIATGFAAVNGYAWGHTVKYSSAGVKLWSVEDADGSSSPEVIESGVATDPAGDVFVAGQALANGQWTMHTVEYSGDGQTLKWSVDDNDGGASSSTLANAVAVDGGGSVIVAGNCALPGRGSSGHTVKYQSTGAQIWSTDDVMSGNGNYSTVNGLACSASGVIFETGQVFTNKTYLMHTVEYAPDGTLLARVDDNGGVGTEGNGSGVAVDSGGNVLATGSVTSACCALARTVKYACGLGAVVPAPTATPAPHAAIGIPCQAFQVVQTAWAAQAYGSVAADGSGGWYAGGYVYDGSNNYAEVDRYNAQGGLLWTSQGPVNSTISEEAVFAAPGGGAWTAGWQSNNFFAERVDPSGAQTFYNMPIGPTNSGESVQGGAVRTDGALAIAGYYWNGSNDDFRVAAFDPTSSNVLWDMLYDWGGRDIANGVSAGPGNELLVTGNTYQNGYQKWTVTALDANGYQIWTDIYDSPADSSAERSGFDASGAAVVAGTINVSGTNEVMLIRYLPDGTRAWTNIQSNSIAEFIDDLRVAPSGQSWTLIQQNGNQNPALLLDLNLDGSQAYPAVPLTNGSGGALLGSTLQPVKSGQVWVVGKTSNGSDFDAFAALYDASGNQQFLGGFGGPGDDVADDVALGQHGAAVVGHKQGGTAAVIVRYGDDACLFTPTPTQTPSASPSPTASPSATASPTSTPTPFPTIAPYTSCEQSANFYAPSGGGALSVVLSSEDGSIYGLGSRNAGGGAMVGHIVKLDQNLNVLGDADGNFSSNDNFQGGYYSAASFGSGLIYAVGEAEISSNQTCTYSYNYSCNPYYDCCYYFLGGVPRELRILEHLHLFL